MLSDVTTNETKQSDFNLAASIAIPRWYVLHTRSHCEQLVHDQLVAKGFRLFLPTIEMWSKRAGSRRVVRTPIFSGYLFLHHVIDKHSYIEVRKTRGLVNILREAGAQLAIVPDVEIDSVRSATQSRLPVRSHPYLREGQKVRILYGALAGTEGIFLQENREKGLLVLSVNLLQRSLAVEVDCSIVEAA